MKIKLADDNQVTNLVKITKLMDILQEQKQKILNGSKMDVFFDYYIRSDFENMLNQISNYNDYIITENQTNEMITRFCSLHTCDVDANNPLSWDCIYEWFEENANSIINIHVINGNEIQIREKRADTDFLHSIQTDEYLDTNEKVMSYISDELKEEFNITPDTCIWLP